jgi:adenylate cyclase
MHQEIERKYLLNAVPKEVLKHESSHISQGWIPGKEIHERLRQRTTGGVSTYFRTIKLGRGISRIEIEEEIDRELFERMWPLTAGKRLEKHRYTVPVGELFWEVDVFLTQELVLAEIELPNESTLVEIPEWLKSCLVREVTDESTYVNINLAK